MPRFVSTKTRRTKHPQTVEAHQFDGTWFNGRFLTEWAYVPGMAVWNDNFTMSIQTPAGEMIAKKHDWITRNDALEFGVVERFTFEDNYAAAE